MCLQLTGGFNQSWKVDLINCFQQSGSFKSDHTLADVVGLSLPESWDYEIVENTPQHITHILLFLITTTVATFH